MPSADLVKNSPFGWETTVPAGAPVGAGGAVGSATGAVAGVPVCAFFWAKRCFTSVFTI